MCDCNRRARGAGPHFDAMHADGAAGAGHAAAGTDVTYINVTTRRGVVCRAEVKTYQPPIGARTKDGMSPLTSWFHPHDAMEGTRTRGERGRDMLMTWCDHGDGLRRYDSFIEGRDEHRHVDAFFSATGLPHHLNHAKVLSL
eukprot:gene3404-23471_t